MTDYAESLVEFKRLLPGLQEALEQNKWADALMMVNRMGAHVIEIDAYCMAKMTDSVERQWG